MDKDGLAFVYHHGGIFVTNNSGQIKYEGGSHSSMVGIDEDTLDVFAVVGYHKELGYDNILNYWWLVPGFRMNMKNGLRSLRTDQDLLDMCRACRENDGVVHLYFEHGVAEPEQIFLLCDDESQQTQPPCSSIDTQQNPTPAPTPAPTPCTKETTKLPIPMPKSLPKTATKCSTKQPIKTTKPAAKPTINTTKSATKQTKAPTTQTKPAAKPTKPTIKSTKLGPVTSSKNKGKEPMVVDDIDESSDSSESEEERLVKRKGKAPMILQIGNVNTDDDVDLSDGCYSWKSDEMRTPPCSEDEEGEGVDVNPEFNEGAEFGSVKLEEDMEFPTLDSFKKAIREYTIQVLERFQK